MERNWSATIITRAYISKIFWSGESIAVITQSSKIRMWVMKKEGETDIKKIGKILKTIRQSWTKFGKKLTKSSNNSQKN